MIPSLPAGSTMTITAEFVPVKFINTGFTTCGDSSAPHTLRLYGGDIAKNNEYLTEINAQNNHVYNTIDGNSFSLRAYDLKTSELTDMPIGTITQKSCPATDLAVTAFSQSFVGDLEVQSVP